MSNSGFRYPDFGKCPLEFRYEHNVVCVYGTKEGLERLIGVIRQLIEKPNQGHVHLEYETNLLTSESEMAAVAIFDKP